MFGGDGPSALISFVVLSPFRAYTPFLRQGSDICPASWAKVKRV